MNNWGVKYFTHDKSYYPVPHTSMKFASVAFMEPLPSTGSVLRLKQRRKNWLRSIVLSGKELFEVKPPKKFYI